MPLVQRPEDSRDPQYSLGEVESRGMDPLRVASCAVPHKDVIRGCPHADRCIFRRQEYGGFGPKRATPGSGGDGPENIAVYHEDGAAGLAVEKSMTCVNFMAGLYDSYTQQDRTGDKIIVLGGPGEKYQHEYLLPVDPNSNKTGNSVMKLHQEVAEVQPFRNFRDKAADSSRRENVMRLREGRRRLMDKVRLERIGISEPEDQEVSEQPKPRGKKADA